LRLDDDIAILAGAPLLGFLGQDVLRLLSFAAERRSLAPGERLFARGDASNGGFVILSGTLALAPRMAGGETLIVGPSSVIGRLALFLPGERPTDAHAVTAAEVLRIPPVVMRRVLAEFPQAAQAIHNELADDLAGLQGDLDRVGARLSVDSPGQAPGSRPVSGDEATRSG
jgi:CRP-like cAMP-binding protein